MRQSKICALNAIFISLDCKKILTKKAMPTTLTPELAAEYKQLFDSCIIKAEKYPEIDKVIQTISNGKQRYTAAETATGVPWYFIGITHSLEGSGKFTAHLHNGDPLTARTVQVPKGRPKTGNPPFTWEVSAADALQLQG